MSQPIPDVDNRELTPRSIATAWFSRQRSGQMTPADERALLEWLDEAPEHREAYRAVRIAWADLGAVRAHPSVMTMREELVVDGRRRTRALAFRAVAACFVVASLFLAGAGAWQWRTAPRPLADRTFSTGFGQRVTVKLPDGSEVTLNTDTVMRTRADGARRLIYLDNGQAFFKVAKDKRHPFVVSAAGRTITAVGTAFDVRVDRGAFKVTLVEGKVRVEGAKANTSSAGTSPSRREVQATEMTAGTELVASGNGEWRLIPTNAVTETSWTKGQLLFDDEPLKDVVAELNRYSHTRMVVADESLQKTSISGNFKPGDVDGFVNALEKFGVARGVATGPDVVELRPLG